MSFIAVGVAGATQIGSAVIQSNAAGDAAELQGAAANQANKKSQKYYIAQRDALKPWMEGGLNAFGEMGGEDFKRDFSASDFQADPGYQFRMDQAMKALERSAAARGGLRSGGTLKAIANHSQNLASNEYQNAYDRFNADRDRRFGRLSSLAGFGERATGQLGNIRENHMNRYSNNLLGAANAQGAAKTASANAWSGALSGVGQAGMDVASMNWMERQKRAASGGVLNGSQAGGSYGNYGGMA
jgi:hypothetical protein